MAKKSTSRTVRNANTFKNFLVSFAEIYGEMTADGRAIIQDTTLGDISRAYTPDTSAREFILGEIAQQFNIG